jgi:protein ImuB
MPRVVSLYLPTWPTDRLRRALGEAAPPADAPLVLVGREGRRRVVLAANQAALASGLRVGLPATQAQARVVGLTIMDADRNADLIALERLGLWVLQRFAPIVAVDPPDGLVIDTTGTDHLHGGEQAMLHSLVARLASSGITARAAIADSWGAAHGFARHSLSPVQLLQPGASADAALVLPISALRLDATTVEGLRALGFERVRDLAATARAPLALRFGPQLGRRLDQMLGALAEPIDPLRPPELVEARRAFFEPIAAAETIARYIGKLVVLLCQELERRGLGAKRLDLRCHRVDAHLQAVRVGMAIPTRDARRLTRLLCDEIETIDPGFGIEILTLTATVAEPIENKQFVSSLVEDSDADISGLIDVLANRVGEQRLYRVSPIASDVPERSFTRIVPMAPDETTNWPDHWPRPSRLLPRPEAVETVALLPDQPPVTFTWRGTRRRVRRADGPERVFGEWWKRDAELAAVRDYFQVEDEAGERFWLYRAGDGENPGTGSHQWFLHGIFG